MILLLVAAIGLVLAAIAVLGAAVRRRIAEREERRLFDAELVRQRLKRLSCDSDWRGHR